MCVEFSNQGFGVPLGVAVQGNEVTVGVIDDLEMRGGLGKEYGERAGEGLDIGAVHGE